MRTLPALAKPRATAVEAGTWRRLTRQLRRQHVDLLDRGRLGEEVAGFSHEGRGDAAGEVGLAAGLVGEGVEDAEGRGPQAEGEPGDRCRLLLDDRQTAVEEALD